MNDQQHLSLANEQCQRAVALMRESGVAPIPRNYEVFYSFAAGQNEALNRALQEKLTQPDAFSDADGNELHEAFLAPPEPGHQVAEYGEKLNEETGEIMGLIQNAVDSTGAFGVSLDDIGSRLANVSGAQQLKTLVVSLVEATQKMRKDSVDLKGRLSESGREIEALQKNLKLVRRESLTDPLTGIANRKSFDRELNNEVAKAEAQGSPMCLCMMDIDHFKAFNDTFGHPAGDLVLKLVAGLIKSVVGKQDHVARYGGEEFTVILPGLDVEAAVGVAERIRHAVSHKEIIRRSTGENLGRLTLSIGIGSHGPNDNAASLLARADHFLYAAKKGGRNRVETDAVTPARGAKQAVPA